LSGGIRIRSDREIIEYLSSLIGKYEDTKGVRIWGITETGEPKQIAVTPDGKVEIAGTISAGPLETISTIGTLMAGNVTASIPYIQPIQGTVTVEELGSISEGKVTASISGGELTGSILGGTLETIGQIATVGVLGTVAMIKTGSITASIASGIIQHVGTVETIGTVKEGKVTASIIGGKLDIGSISEGKVVASISGGTIQEIVEVGTISEGRLTASIQGGKLEYVATIDRIQSLGTIESAMMGYDYDAGTLRAVKVADDGRLMVRLDPTTTLLPALHDAYDIGSDTYSYRYGHFSRAIYTGTLLADVLGEKTSGAEITIESKIKMGVNRIVRTVNDDYLNLCGGQDVFEGASITLAGQDVEAGMARIRCGGDALSSPSSAGGILFQVRAAGVTTPLAKITGDGKVGIGTTSPAEKLHVASGNILLDNDYWIKWKDSSGSPQSLIIYNAADKLLFFNRKTASDISAISFYTTDADGAIQSRLYIQSGVDSPLISLYSRPATDTKTLISSPTIRLWGAYWDGAASQTRFAEIQYHITSTTPTSELALRVAETTRLRITDADEILPRTDNVGSIGTNSYRWALVRAVTITQGDLNFARSLGKVKEKVLIGYDDEGNPIYEEVEKSLGDEILFTMTEEYDEKSGKWKLVTKNKKGEKILDLEEDGKLKPKAGLVTEDILFSPSDQPCPKCGKRFEVGDIITLRVSEVLRDGSFKARPIHLKCAG